MAIVTKEVIFLGNFADADTDESSMPVENTGIYQQTFGSAANPLNDSREAINFDDRNNNGSIDTNNMSTTDTTQTARGPSQLDSLAVVNITVTYQDNTTATYNSVVMFQTANGDLFLANSNFNGTDIRGPAQKEIQSATIDTITSTNYNGLWHNAFQSFACFVEGTNLETPTGLRAINDMQIGDLIETLDHGPRPIRWIGQSTVLQMGKMAPVCIAKGALGCGLPRTELRVSQQHRMMVRSKIAQDMIGSQEALIAAKFLLPIHGVKLQSDVKPITYVHLLFDQHEIVKVEGAPSESLFPGPDAFEMLGPENSKEIKGILLKSRSWPNGDTPARPFLEGHKRRRAVARHLKNAKPILTSSPYLKNEHTYAGL